MVRVPIVPQWLRWVVVGLVILAIVIYSLVPLPDSVSRLGPLGLLRLSDYAHLVSYAGLALLLGYALVDDPRPDWLVLGGIFLFVICFGGLMELLQSAVPHRRASSADILINGLGTTVALFVWRVVQRHLRFYRPRAIEQ